MSDNVHYYSDFGHVDPHATFHHQHFQIVDLMMLYFKGTVNGLNPCALPHEPTEHIMKHVEENNTSSEGEKKEQQKSRIKKLMTG